MGKQSEEFGVNFVNKKLYQQSWSLWWAFAEDNYWNAQVFLYKEVIDSHAFVYTISVFKQAWK